MITIALAADAGFAMQLAVVLTSLVAQAEAPVEVYILHDGFDDKLRRRVAAGAMDLKVTWVPVKMGGLHDVEMPSYLGTAALLRLLLPSLLPGSVERVLYLDADVLVRKELDELWATDLGGRSSGAVRDAVIPWAGSPRSLPWRELNMSPKAPYFNSGVLLMDLAAWRERDVAGRAFAALRRQPMLYGDQCGLNAVGPDDILQMDPRWNLQVGHLEPDRSSAWLVERREVLAAALADPAIVHFNTGPLGRPWRSGCAHPWRREWLEVLDRTSWAGWRPSLKRELVDELRQLDRGKRILSRLRVASHALFHGD